MKRMKHKTEVGGSGGSENESGSIAPDLLEIGKKILKTAHKCTRQLFG